LASEAREGAFTLSWKLARLRAMGPGEIAWRTARAAAVEIERRKWSSGTQAPRWGAPRALSTLPVAPDHEMDFYFSHRDRSALIARATALKGDWVEEARRSAGRILSGKVRLLGKEYDLGRRIEWERDYETRVSAPHRFYGGINYRDHRSVGDARRIWELNRHQYLVPVAKEYFLEGGEELAEFVLRRIEDWIDRNPPYWGINWTSALEHSFRVFSWVWIWKFLERSPTFDEGRRRKLLRSLYWQGDYLKRHLSRYSSANNHLIGEAAGLALLGMVFPQLPESEKWREQGLGIMWEELPVQFHRDGVNKEQATNYQLLVVEFYLAVAILCLCRGVPVPAQVWEYLERAVRFLLAVSGADGEPVEFGDSDDCQILDFTGSGEPDRAGTMGLGLDFFGIDPARREACRLNEKSLWLLRGEARPVKKASRRNSTAFRRGGYAVMRGGPAGGEKFAVFDCGSLGYLSTAAHGHADALSFTLEAYGRRMIVDPGTYCYHSEPQWRDYFRSTWAHSSVTVDGRNQSVMAGPFLWSKKADAKCDYWITSRVFDLAEGRHDGFRKQGLDVIHLRTLCFAKPDYFLVRDRLEGRGKHEAIGRLQLAPEAVVKSEGPSAWRVEYPEDALLLVRAFSASVIEGEVVAGRTGREPGGWFSPRLGVRCEAPALQLRLSGELPLEWVVLLIPLPRGYENSYSVESEMARHTALKVAGGDFRDEWCIGAERGWDGPAGSFRGDILWRRLRPGCEVEALALHKYWYFESGGLTLPLTGEGRSSAVLGPRVSVSRMREEARKEIA